MSQSGNDRLINLAFRGKVKRPTPSRNNINLWRCECVIMHLKKARMRDHISIEEYNYVALSFSPAAVARSTSAAVTHVAQNATAKGRAPRFEYVRSTVLRAIIDKDNFKLAGIKRLCL